MPARGAARSSGCSRASETARKHRASVIFARSMPGSTGQRNNSPRRSCILYAATICPTGVLPKQRIDQVGVAREVYTGITPCLSTSSRFLGIAYVNRDESVEEKILELS